MPPPTNEAAWIMTAGANPLEVKPAPYTPPSPGQMVVRNAAIAVNPLDWAKQFVGDKRWEHQQHPHVLGEDMAGVVVEVAPDVTRFKPGDRVLAHAVGFYAYGARAAEGSFQRYTIAREHMAAPIPDTLSFEQACAIPMCCSAAACALFQKTHMALSYPTVPPAAPNGQFLIITGASTAVGCNAIQLARCAGYGVATTCSPRSFDHAKRLGASLVFDYHTPTLEADMVAALKGKTVAGAFAIGSGAVELCIGVMGQMGPDSRKYVVKASFPWPKDELKTGDEYIKYMKWVDGWNQDIAARAVAVGVDHSYVEGAELGRNEVSKVIYEDFLPNALAKGIYLAAPEPQIVGTGLEHVQKALDIQKKGVNAKKVVVLLG